MHGLARSSICAAVTLLIAGQAAGFGRSALLLPGGPIQLRLAGKLTDVEPSEEQLPGGHVLTLQLLGNVTLFLDQPGADSRLGKPRARSFHWREFGPFRNRLRVVGDQEVMDRLQEEAALGHYVRMWGLFYRSGGRLVVYDLDVLGSKSSVGFRSPQPEPLPLPSEAKTA